MADKIDGLGQQPRVTPSRSPQAEPAASGPARRSESVTAEDTLNLTDQARQLQDLERTLASLPVVDEARVAELKEAVASGRYEVDADRVAEKLRLLERRLPFVDPRL